MRHALAFLLLCLCAGLAEAGVHSTGAPSTTNNDDSCDIALLPAATLLLPYFEVDLSAASGQGETTLFTITNVTHEAQVAAITLWTDYSFPVVTMHVYLTGYDTQSINLYDVIQQGLLAPPRGTSASQDQGDFSIENPALDIDNCFDLPGAIPPAFASRIRSALTQGSMPALGTLPACQAIGSVHTRASGYVTIDVVGSCNFTQPDDATFAAQLRFDNVLVGDYQQVHGAQGSAQGGPLVHIRAIPEGDAASTSNVPRTFYGRFMPAANPNYDRRQPLPSVYAAHWIDGGPGSFSTDLKIWREGATGTGASCSDYQNRNHNIRLVEIAMFDEEENGLGLGIDDSACVPPCDSWRLNTGRHDLDDDFPLPNNGANAGWIYLNLDNPDRAGAQQAWVIASMRAENRYSVDVEALALGNGCSPNENTSIVSSGSSDHFIGPLPNVNP